MMINETLRMLRTINGLTGKELANNLDISTSYLSEMENGKKMPSLDLLQKYSGLFEIKLSTLILFTEQIGSETDGSSPRARTKDMLFRFMKFLDGAEKHEKGE